MTTQIGGSALTSIPCAPAVITRSDDDYNQSLYHTHGDPRGVFAVAVDAVRLLLEVLLARTVDVAERLRVAVHQREPRRLHLHHQPMARPERVVHIGKRELD